MTKTKNEKWDERNISWHVKFAKLRQLWKTLGSNIVDLIPPNLYALDYDIALDYDYDDK